MGPAGRLLYTLLLCSFAACTAEPPQVPVALPPASTVIQTQTLQETAQWWPPERPADALRDARLITDPRRPVTGAAAIAPFAVRTNHLIGPVQALVLANEAVAAARDVGLDPSFFCATILEESGFSPTIMSPAGAVGIAQFTIDTADGLGIDPFDPHQALRASAQLLASYVDRYTGRYADPQAAALAAYNAGPEAVAHYHGVPPYPETREYIADITGRQMRILLMGVPAFTPRARRRLLRR